MRQDRGGIRDVCIGERVMERGGVVTGLRNIVRGQGFIVAKRMDIII